MMTLEKVQELARVFLEVADENNEFVSNYIDGSNNETDRLAYEFTIDAEKDFVKAYNEYYGEKYEPCLNYELADSVFPY